MEFLSRYVKPTQYKELLPPLEHLTSQYHVDPETAFTAVRPLISLLYVRVHLFPLPSRVQFPSIYTNMALYSHLRWMLLPAAL